MKAEQRAPDSINQTLGALLSTSLDYAGLFPPAQLSMSEAVSEFAKYLMMEESWMLSRFVLPISELEEFEARLARLKELNNRNRATLSEARRPWKISVLAGVNIEKDLRVIDDFNIRRLSDGAKIDTIEFKPESDIEAALNRQAKNLTLYFEFSLSDDKLSESFKKLRAAGAFAKMRTGGVVRESFPSASEIADFISLCHEAHVPFKATAGLHHAIRSERSLPDGSTVMMNGFINLILASTLIHSRMANSAVATECLLETEAQNFRFSKPRKEAAITWREYNVTLNQIEDARKDLVHSFGSCSFLEPLEDLRALGLG